MSCTAPGRLLVPLLAPVLLPCCPLPPQAHVPHLQVTATVCREGTLQEVAVRLGVESALGTTSVVHFCGAQFQVPPGTPRPSAVDDTCGTHSGLKAPCPPHGELPTRSRS